MVEQDAVAGEKTVGLPVVDRYPVRIELGDAVRRARIEGRPLGLRRFVREPEELGGRSLVEPRLVLESQDSDRFQQPQRTERVGIGGVFRLFE